MTSLVLRPVESTLAELGGIDRDEELVSFWLDSQTSPATRRSYRTAIDWWRGELGGAFELRAPHLLARLRAVLLRHRDATPATLAHRVAALRSLLRLAHEIGYLAANPGPLLRTRAVPRTIAARILEPDQVVELLAAARTPRDRLVVRVLYVGAVRVSELVGLDWEHVRFHDGAASATINGKGGRTREIALSAGTAAELERFGPEPRAGAIFRTRTGGRLSARDVRRIVIRAARAAGIPGNVSPHWLRHSLATHATARGAPVPMVAAHLGHASIATTSAYLHVRPRPELSQWIDL